MCWGHLYLVMETVLEAVEVLAQLCKGQESLGHKRIEIKLPGLNFSWCHYKQHPEWIIMDDGVPWMRWMGF